MPSTPPDGNESSNNPAYRHGLGLFQMVVNSEAVLIYAGRTERDAERYITMEGARVVTKFKGDVLADSSSDMYVREATPAQVTAWTAGFLAAIDFGEADVSDPAAFAISPM